MRSNLCQTKKVSEKFCPTQKVSDNFCRSHFVIYIKIYKDEDMYTCMHVCGDQIHVIVPGFDKDAGN